MTKEQEVVGWVIFGIIVIALAIKISQGLFPIFLIGSLVAFVGLVIVLIIELKSGDLEYVEPTDTFSFKIFIVFLILVVGTFVTYGIGYGLGGTFVGQTTVGAYDTITGAEKQIEEAYDTSINQLIETSCQNLPEDQCQILKDYAKTAKTLQEVQDMADQLQATSGLGN